MSSTVSINGIKVESCNGKITVNGKEIVYGVNKSSSISSFLTGLTLGMPLGIFLYLLGGSI